MKNIVFLILIAWQSIIACAQYRIKGSVTNREGKPVDAAVVIFTDTKTGNVVTQGITSANGIYTMNAKGEIQIHISCLGFERYTSHRLTVTKDTVISPICLSTADFMLSDVVVTGEKHSPSIKAEKGKIVFTLNNSNITAGGTALDVLKKTPGLFVDGDNNVSIGGKGGVLIMLNGKQTYMQKDELTTLLKTTPASLVSQVEIMENPSAQYDAEGSGGIININMTKKKQENFYLSLNNGISYWNNIRENTELSFGYNKNNFSMQGSYSHALGNYEMNYGMHRIQEGKIYHSPTKDTDKRKTISGSLNMEYNMGEKHTIGGRIDINTLSGPGQTNTVTEIQDAETGTTEQTLYAKNNYYMQKGNRYGCNIYYTASNKMGASYTVDFNYAWFDGGSGNMQPNKYVSPNGTVKHESLYKSVNSRDINIYTLSHHQKHNLWSGELKSGLKLSSVKADNSYRFYDVTNEQEDIDALRSNDFLYKERILAAYLLYSHPIGNKMSMEAGLRGEYTSSDGLLHTYHENDNKNTRKNYFNLFPTLNINYQLNDSHAITLSYSSRIDRPAYQDLNPFEYLLDELSYWKGNPFLTPQKTHRAALTYSHNKTIITASYQYMKDYKAQITDTLSTNKVIMTPKNIGKQQRVSISLYQGVNITRWWEMNLSLIGYYLKNNIAFDSYRKFNLDGVAGIFSVHNTIILPWQIRMELNGMYATKRLGAANERIAPSGYIDVGLSKSFDNNRWTINLTMSDVLWTNRWDNHSSFKGFSLRNWGKGESRQIKLNVRYKFGVEKIRKHDARFNELDRL